jgi:predicted transcriptional regulator
VVEVIAATDDVKRRHLEGFKMTDVLLLSASHRQLIHWVTRQGQEVSLGEMVAHLQQPEIVVRAMLKELVQQGFLQEVKQRGHVKYRSRMAPKRGNQLSSKIWKALDE